MQTLKSISILDSIEFPIYGITNDYRRIWEDMNVLYIETDSGVYTLDNKNVPGDTLGKRRLRINAGKKYIPKKVVYSISQMLHSAHNIFIDNTGSVFRYKKTMAVPLRYHVVDKIVKMEEGCVLLLKGIDYPIQMNCREAHSIKSVGLLHSSIGYILYEYSESVKNNSWRKI